MKSSGLIEVLKKTLKAKGITYSEVARRLQISEASVKRTFSERSFTLDRLERVCDIADVSIGELAMVAEGLLMEKGYEYSVEQEAFFCDHPKHLAFFDLLIRFGDVADVENKFLIKKRTSAKYQKDLEALGLIERLPGNKVKICVSRKISWRANGLLQRKFMTMARQEFLHADFRGKNELSSLHSVALTEKSIQYFCKTLNEISREIEHANEFDSKIGAKTQSFGLFFGFRPWEFSVLNTL